jgi:hypothetical protein
MEASKSSESSDRIFQAEVRGQLRGGRGRVIGSGRMREAARCMDFAMPRFSSLVARFCATSTPVLQISKRLAAQSFMELWARSTAPKSGTLGHR